MNRLMNIYQIIREAQVDTMLLHASHHNHYVESKMHRESLFDIENS